MTSANRSILVLVVPGMVLVLAGAVWFFGFRRPPSSIKPAGGVPDVPLSRYHGRIVDQLGRSIPGVEIKAASLPHAIAGRTQALSRRNGSFSLDLPDDYPPRVTLTKSGYVTEFFDLLPDEMGKHEYPMQRAAVLTGAVYQKNGGPIPRARVRALDRRQWSTETETDTEGQFRLEAPAGPITLEIHSSRFADVTVHDLQLSRDRTNEWQGELVRGTSLRLRVLDRNQPLVGAKVDVRTRGGDRESASTDASGSVAINGLGGAVIDYSVTRPGYGARSDRISQDRDSSFAEVTVRLEPVDPLTISLSDPAGRTIPVGPSDHLRVTLRQHEIVNAALSDVPALRVIGPGTYQFTITTVARAEFNDRVTVNADSDAVSVVLPIGGRILGAASDEAGSAVPGATILFSPEAQPAIGVAQTGRTTTAGQFRSWFLRPGTVYVRIEHDTAGSWQDNVMLGDGAVLDLGAVTLKK